MAFSNTHVSVADYENERFVQTEISDPSELKALIDMNRSYKIHPETKRPVLANYRYKVTLKRDDVCKLEVVYDAPTKITIEGVGPKADLFADLSYKKASGTLNVRRLTVTYVVQEDADEPPTDAEVAGELARAVALFRVAGEIAPLTFSEKLKIVYNAERERVWEPAAKGALAKRAAALRAGVKRQLADCDVLAMLQ